MKVYLTLSDSKGAESKSTKESKIQILVEQPLPF